MSLDLPPPLDLRLVARLEKCDMTPVTDLKPYAPFCGTPPVVGWAAIYENDSGRFLYRDADGLFFELVWSAGSYPGGATESRVTLDSKYRTEFEEGVYFAPKIWRPKDGR